jgi:hypothetical protein
MNGGPLVRAGSCLLQPVHGVVHVTVNSTNATANASYLETWAPFANQAGLLDLSNRNITAVPVNAFKGMPSLVKLSLRENQLSTLPSGVFADLSSLRSLVCLREFESVLVRVCLSLALSHMHF